MQTSFYWAWGLGHTRLDLILLEMGVGSHQTGNADLILLDMGVGSHQTGNADLVLLDMRVGSH